MRIKAQKLCLSLTEIQDDFAYENHNLALSITPSSLEKIKKKFKILGEQYKALFKQWKCEVGIYKLPEQSAQKETKVESLYSKLQIGYLNNIKTVCCDFLNNLLTASLIFNYYCSQFKASSIVNYNLFKRWIIQPLSFKTSIK
ncbi:MAG: hypothetical protein MTP17_01660 [Candidatus Midichloria sp.]|nr:MAG: hypothetical protein MTP17_01660 [Candidatus Midichloria sp.]